MNDRDKTSARTLPDLILENGKKSQFLLLGDTSHENKGIAQEAFGPKSLDAMQQAGIKTLMIESFTASQNLFDAYAEKSITRDQFKDILKHNAKPAADFDWDKDLDAMATLVDNTHARGIKLIAVDGDEGNYNALLYQEETRRTNAELIQQASSSPDMRIPKSFYDSVTKDIEAEMQKDGSYDQLRYDAKPKAERPAISRLDGFSGRMELDTSSLAQRIYQSAGGEPAAVFYGNWHFAKVNDVDEELNRLTAANPSAREQATQVINIYNKRDETSLKSQRDFCGEFQCAAQPDHINYYMEFSTPDRGNRGYQPASTPAMSR